MFKYVCNYWTEVSSNPFISLSKSCHLAEKCSGIGSPESVFQETVNGWKDFHIFKHYRSRITGGLLEKL